MAPDKEKKRKKPRTHFVWLPAYELKPGHVVATSAWARHTVVEKKRGGIVDWVITWADGTRWGFNYDESFLVSVPSISAAKKKVKVDDGSQSR